MRTSAGIDYGNGVTNIDVKTGIRYGVISQYEVLQAWCDESERNYGPPTCGHCGTELTKRRRARIENGLVTWCGGCHARIEDISDTYPEEPVALEYVGGGYECRQSRDDTDVFILKSPFYTYAAFCSPCAPGAGYLMNWFEYKFPNETGNYIKAAERAGFPKVYCFGHDWFEGKARGKKDCAFCKGVQNVKRHKHGPNGAEWVLCWVCDGKGVVDNYVQEAPYPVFDVKTRELVKAGE